jgi:hypothetical protein
MVGIEYVGVMDLDPPLDPELAAAVADSGRAASGGWLPTRDGSSMRPRPDADPDELVRWLRDFVAAGHTAVVGVIAVFDTDTHQLVLVRARAGRVTRRTARPGSLPVARSNVIDLASHRRTVSRQIG